MGRHTVMMLCTVVLVQLTGVPPEIPKVAKVKAVSKVIGKEILTSQ